MLKSLRIRNFRNLVDLKIDQLGRINLFTGRNNSGKTTLLEAVYLMLGFGLPTAAPQINAFRGLFDSQPDKSPVVVQDIVWKPMFYRLDTSREIVLSAGHSSHGASRGMINSIFSTSSFNISIVMVYRFKILVALQTYERF